MRCWKWLIPDRYQPLSRNPINGEYNLSFTGTCVEWLFENQHASAHLAN
jgi:hypothetical protein